jgi:hypothetical protein
MSGITNPAEKYFKDGLWTFDGTVWRPQNQLLSYRDTVNIAKSNTNADAGPNILQSDAVPSGEVHVITSIIAWNDTTAVTMIRLYKGGYATAYYIDLLNAPAAKVPVKYQGQLVVKAGGLVCVLFNGCTAGDDLYLYACGYKFLIAE